MPGLVATCVWRVRPEVVLALDRRFGEPVDAYVNGSQVWLRDDGPGGLTLEWRLHPVAGFVGPDGVSTQDLFPAAALALGTDHEAASPSSTPFAHLWDGLEAFSAYGEEVEPAPLATAVTTSLGITPDAAGLVDHQAVGDRWEATGGKTSIVEALLAQLASPT
ncbi:MAG: hypothetical protein ACR2G7_11620 [Acidimicrobiales bacterium]